CALREGAARYHRTDRSSASCFGPDLRPLARLARPLLFAFPFSHSLPHSAILVSILARASWVPLANLADTNRPHGSSVSSTDLPCLVIGTPQKAPVRALLALGYQSKLRREQQLNGTCDFGCPHLRRSGLLLLVMICT
ncbi:hypothetical protein CCMA1212_008717, partial [Trichoderma ghanense]